MSRQEFLNVGLQRERKKYLISLFFYLNLDGKCKNSELSFNCCRREISFLGLASKTLCSSNFLLPGHFPECSLSLFWISIIHCMWNHLPSMCQLYVPISRSPQQWQGFLEQEEFPYFSKYWPSYGQRMEREHSLEITQGKFSSRKEAY